MTYGMGERGVNGEGQKDADEHRCAEAGVLLRCNRHRFPGGLRQHQETQGVEAVWIVVTSQIKTPARVIETVKRGLYVSESIN